MLPSVAGRSAQATDPETSLKPEPGASSARIPVCIRAPGPRFGYGSALQDAARRNRGAARQLPDRGASLSRARRGHPRPARRAARHRGRVVRAAARDGARSRQDLAGPERSTAARQTLVTLFVTTNHARQRNRCSRRCSRPRATTSAISAAVARTARQTSRQERRAGAGEGSCQALPAVARGAAGGGAGGLAAKKDDAALAEIREALSSGPTGRWRRCSRRRC